MLDQAQEYVKADDYFEKYFTTVLKYKERVGRLAKSDYLPQLSVSCD